MTKRKQSRERIQQALYAAINKALVRSNCPRDLIHERRVLRAMVRLGVGRLLSMGVPVQRILDEMGRAFSAEHQDFQQHKRKGGASAGWGLPVALA